MFFFLRWWGTKNWNHEDCFHEIAKGASFESPLAAQLFLKLKCMLDLYPSNSNDRFFFRLYSYESSWPLLYLFKLNSYQVHKWGEMELGRLGLKNASIVYLRSQICFALWKLTDCQAGDDHVMWNNRHSQYTFRRLSSCDTANELSLHYIAWPSLSLGQEMLYNGRRFLKVAKELKFRAKVEKKVNDHVKEIRKKWDLEKKKKMDSKFPSSCELSSSGSGLRRMNASDHLKWSQSHHMTIVMMMFAWHKTFVFIMVHLCVSSSLI